ncbi:MAG: prephenate dehydratase [Nanoarchaeota archaeon]
MKIKLVCQGIKGSYSYQTANIFKRELEKLNLEVKEIISVKNFDELFNFVKKGYFGVIPIENSLIGTIFENYKKIINNNFKITFDYYLKIEHCLLAKKKIDLKEIKKVISHPAALKQCLNFLKENNLDFENFEDTASAAKFVSETNEEIAAIASKEAAEVYNLKIIKENVQDFNFNFTRFFLISKDFDYLNLVKNNEKKDIITTLTFELKDTPASLFKALMPFAVRFINLKKIDSFFIPEKPFHYKFLVEAEISRKEKLFSDLIDELNCFIENLKIISSFKSLNKPL